MAEEQFLPPFQVFCWQTSPTEYPLESAQNALGLFIALLRHRFWLGLNHSVLVIGSELGKTVLTVFLVFEK
jgi:hypothetical protein